MQIEESIVFFRFPESTEIHKYQGIPSSIITENTFCFAPFDVQKDQTLFLDLKPIENNSDINLNFSLAEHTDKSTSKDDFIKFVQEIQENIHAEKINKSVAAKIKTIEKPEHFNAIDFFMKLTKIYPNSFCYLFYTKQTGLWIGATPELLLAKKNTKVKTVSLAGTRLQNSTFTAKEIEEQAIVSNYIQDILKPISSSTTQETSEIQTGHLTHIKTSFQFELVENKNSLEIALALHPTPAVGGFPKAESTQIIVDHEPIKRQYYSGFLGTITNSDAQLYVNIRCMQVYKNSLTLYAGCGITKDSDAEKEWNETENKLDILQHVLKKLYF